MIRRTAAVSGVALALALSLTACGGSDAATKGKSAHAVLTLAKQKFDKAKSVHLVLSTEETPTSGDAVLGAEGTLTHQPAFEGKVTVVLSGFNAEVPVVAVDDKVFAKLPLTPKYVPIDPAEYGSPDPADFADTSKGISALLLKLDGAKKTGQRPRGSDHSQRLQVAQLQDDRGHRPGRCDRHPPGHRRLLRARRRRHLRPEVRRLRQEREDLRTVTGRG
jgi:lipoprotein LprG